MFALADCNNFYASCQRLFAPHLEGKPIVVLSNNDGCIVARSNEAKALGIPMGAPEYQWQHFLKHHQVHVFSSNYALYGDMSGRVMRTLERFQPDSERYSIDEAFLRMHGIPPEKMREHALEIRRTVLQWVGLPLSIGIAPTKTLAKLANHVCKKNENLQGVLVFDSVSDAVPYMQKADIGTVWGIGRRWAEKLHYDGIHTAADLVRADHRWVRRRYSVVLQRTALELAGQSCIELDEVAERKQILVSRSFRPKISDFNRLRASMSGYISRAGEKLRDQHSLSKNITVFIHTNLQTTNCYANSHSVNLSQYTADTATLIRAGTWALKKIYREGHDYYKAGVMLNDIIPDKNQQLSLFTRAAYDEAARKRMQLLDSINKRFGAETLCFGSESRQRWKMHQMHLSPCYTTRWEDLLVVPDN